MSWGRTMELEHSGSSLGVDVLPFLVEPSVDLHGGMSAAANALLMR